MEKRALPLEGLGGRSGSVVDDAEDVVLGGFLGTREDGERRGLVVVMELV